MRTTRLLAGAAIAASVVAVAQPALALPPPNHSGDPIPHCRTGFHWDEDLGKCVSNPPPGHAPMLLLDVARQAGPRGGVEVAGWTADADAPTAPLTVHISIDDAPATNQVADGSRPDVAAVYPRFGAAHGFSATLPASATGHTVCVSVDGLGTGGGARVCRSMDDIVEFQGSDIDYDTGQAKIATSHIEQLDKVSNRNASAVNQSTQINGQKTLTDTHGWSDTEGVKIGTSFKANVFWLVEGNVTMEGSLQFTQNGSSSESRTFGWQQPVVVPARSQIVTTVAITQSTLTVPYVMKGNFVYRSGLQVPGSLRGTYTGVTSHDLEVEISQFDLNGNPAARAVAQSAPTLSYN